VSAFFLLSNWWNSGQTNGATNNIFLFLGDSSNTQRARPGSLEDEQSSFKNRHHQNYRSSLGTGEIPQEEEEEEEEFPRRRLTLSTSEQSVVYNARIPTIHISAAEEKWDSIPL